MIRKRKRKRSEIGNNLKYSACMSQNINITVKDLYNVEEGVGPVTKFLYISVPE